MAKKLIAFDFDGDFVPELASLSKSYAISEISTRYCTTALSKFREYSTDTYLAEAIANYIGSINTMHLFVGRTTKNEYVAEYKKPENDETQICIGHIRDGEFIFMAGVISGTGHLCQYPESHKGTIFTMAMFPEIAKDPEAMCFLDVLINYKVSNENYSKSMCCLSNNIYYRLKDDKSSSPVRYEQEIQPISQADIDAVTISKVFCGEPKVFNRSVPGTFGDFEETISSKVSATKLRNLYPIDEKRILSAEEESRVPDLGECYIVPEWSVKTAKKIAFSSRFRKTIRNILLYGPSGTGKTEGSQAIAAMLGLPYYTITCSADDDKFDLIGQFIPNTKKGKKNDTNEEASKEPDISSLSDAENDYTYVESELIQAIKTGGFCEIQEANIIKRSSVIEALNPLLAGCGKKNFIKLPTGEVITRHPDCVIAFTINRDYEGCNDLQEAVYSRINLVKQIPEPTENDLFERAKAQTGFDNTALLRRMSKCVAEIHQYCREKDITGGVCGPRELIDWAQDAMLESEDMDEARISEKAVIAAALETVLQKVAQNGDDIEDVIAGVFNKHFSPSVVNAIRKEIAV